MTTPRTKPSTLSPVKKTVAVPAAPPAVTAAAPDAAPAAAKQAKPATHAKASKTEASPAKPAVRPSAAKDKVTGSRSATDAKAPAKAEQKAASKIAVKEEKLKKPKMIKGKFKIPKAEYRMLKTLKERASALSFPTKKSRLLRAGIKAMAAMSDTALLAALAAVTGQTNGSRFVEKPTPEDKPTKKARSPKR